MERHKMAASKVGGIPLVFAMLNVFLCGGTHVRVQTSVVEDVPKYSTAILYRIYLENTGHHTENVTLAFDKCCWVIEQDDTDCEIMILRPAAVSHELSPKNTSLATFAFYNLYTRYRQGECHFTVRTSGAGSSTWKHTVSFDTTPKPNNTLVSDSLLLANLCEGLDQDPDRDCTPVDCAVKYRGMRNFYRNTTGRCEKVTPCNTRGTDGLSVVAYYDRETNICHRLDWLDGNEINQIESDTEIPQTINSSTAKYFAGFEPTKLSKEHVTLQCNHGQQTGIYCQCDEGWVSSGLDPQYPTVYHWCDKKSALPKLAQFRAQQPRHLNKPAEVMVVTLLTLVNLVLLGLWLYLLSLLILHSSKLRQGGIRKVMCAPLFFCQQRCSKRQQQGLLTETDSTDEELYSAR